MKNPNRTVPESAQSNYEVGYKKPPRNTQFCKGKSGNPAGRPKRAINVRASLNKTMSSPVLVRIDGKVKKMSAWEAFLINLKTEMLRGNLKAVAMLLKIMAAAGMMKVPEDSEADVSITREEQRMLEDLSVRWGLNDSSNEDQVDSLAQALAWFTKPRRPTLAFG